MSGVGPKSAPTYNIPAPTNYVAGIGRGAMGFTTRSDIGPARAAPMPIPAAPFPAASPVDPNFGQAPAGYVAGRGRGMGELAKTQAETPADGDRGDYSESNYDEFAGYGERLFAGGAYDEDDREADQIYGQVDDLMDARRKRSREKQQELEQVKAKSQRPRIADQFADLKRELSTVTIDQWEAIPDVGDSSLKRTQQTKKESYMPVPDNIIQNAASGSGMSRTADATVDFSAGITSSLSGTRGLDMAKKLDKIGDSITGQTVVDPQGYMTSLNSIHISSDAEIADINKARKLLESVTKTNPKHGPGWIAAARVEEIANKPTLARKKILEGCKECPQNEDVWLEAARLHPLNEAKAILANAVQHIPDSVKIWLKAADLETAELRKKAVLRRALEFVPNSVPLWKAAIELENVNDAKIMLARAVECVPESVEMWLALAKLETHENARKVLNQAREAIPTERATWITAAKLEEAHGNTKIVAKIIEKMIVSLTQYQVTIKRDEWLQEAIDCERANAIETCTAIVRNTIHLGVDEEDRKKTWMDDADACLAMEPPAVHTARAILKYAIEIFPHKKSLWQQLAMLEKEFGTLESLEKTLLEGVEQCKTAEVLWLMAAKEKWLQGNVSEARGYLFKAFEHNPQSEQIWLAAIKLEWENNEFERTRALLDRARKGCSTEHIYIKSILFEQEMKQYKRCLELIDEAIIKYSNYNKFYLLGGEICWKFTNEFIKARNYYLQGIKNCQENSIPLWIMLIRLEESVKGVIKARPTGEMARLKLLNQSDLLWLECIRLERRNNNLKLAENLMSQALQHCGKSAILWSEVLLTAPKPQQRLKAMEALKKVGDNSAILSLAIARLFQQNNRIKKALKWYERCLNMDSRFGDAYIYYYARQYIVLFKMELISDGSNMNNINKGVGEEEGESSEEPGSGMDGLDDEPEDDNLTTENTGDNRIDTLIAIEKRCIEAEPNSGELWNSITKEIDIRRKPVDVKLRIAVERILNFPLKYRNMN